MLRLFNKIETLMCCKCKFPSLNMKQKALYYSKPQKTYYACLGLEPNASPKEIKSAYYNLSLKLHPDKNEGCALSTEKFREITEAYEVLSNPEKKRIYDRDLNLSFDPYSTSANPYSYPQHRTPRTGRTRYYNYDEHYRQHYENYYKQKEAEHEQFRRRWEADRRHRYGDEFAWSKYSYTKRDSNLKTQLLLLFRSKSFVYLTTLWLLLFIAGLVNDVFYDADEPKKQQPLYYKVSDKKESGKLYYEINKSNDKKE